MSKWLADVTPNDRAADVAARALSSRLDVVRHYLRRSVKRPGEPENIHQLRVWTRRSEAALALYADLLPKRRAARMRQMLRRLRRAAGRVRDCDVFALWEFGPGGAWPARLRLERAKAQRKLVAQYDRLDGGRKLRRRTAKLLARLRARNEGRAETFAERARSGLRPVLAAFLNAIPTPQATEAALHQFRIRGKGLRYAMELLAPGFPPAFRDELYPQVEALQETLGQVNDLVGARDRLATSAGGKQGAIWHRRLAETEADLARARAAFHREWGPETGEALRQRFDEFLRPPSSPDRSVEK